MASRLLVVEVSGSMRSVLGKYVESLGFEVLCVDGFGAADSALASQYKRYDTDFAGLLLGWPSVADADATELIERLDSPDLADLPVIVLSTDMRAETRAWVAGRHNTAVVPWKDYQRVEELLPGLLDKPADTGNVFIPKFDNRDIRLLVVDDSPSIRFALTDLFTLHGYQVTQAGTHEEALEAAQQQAHDIAIIDFYLEGRTGDALCRDLIADPRCGDITCTVLTGTYADHIIKRSLRAGAVECMFKSESSELLLARIDAISRLIRQCQQVSSEQGRLERIVSMIAGPSLVIDAEQRLRYCTEACAGLLGYSGSQDLLALPASELVDLDALNELGSSVSALTLRTASGETRRLPCRAVRLPDTQEILLSMQTTVDGGVTREASVAQRLSWPPTTLGFIRAMAECHPPAADAPNRQLAVLDVCQGGIQEDDPRQAVSDDTLLSMLAQASIAERLNDVTQVFGYASIGNGRLVLLIEHDDAPAAYRWIRLLMQELIELSPTVGGAPLTSTAAVTALSANAERTPVQTLHRLQSSQALMAGRERNCALLLDVKRLLPVYAPNVQGASSA